MVISNINVGAKATSEIHIGGIGVSPFIKLANNETEEDNKLELHPTYQQTDVSIGTNASIV
jgi:hypothetical protein